MRTWQTKLALPAIAVFLALGTPLHADEFELPKSLRKVAFDQRLNERLPVDLSFKDEAGSDVTLGSYFDHGKPVILVLAYFRCPRLCSEVLNGLIRALLEIDLRPGTDFDIIVISF